MRVYLALVLDDLVALEAGEPISPPAFLAASEDEEDELAALEEAAERAPVAAAAELVDPDETVTLSDIVSFHLDADGTGDLAWYATQELSEVVRAVREDRD